MCILAIILVTDHESNDFREMQAWRLLRTIDTATNDCPNVSSALKVAVIRVTHSQVSHYTQGRNRVSCSGYVQHSAVLSQSVKQGTKFTTDTKITYPFKVILGKAVCLSVVKQRTKRVIACLSSSYSDSVLYL